MPIRHLLRGLALAALLPIAAAAQSVRGTVVERGGSSPIPGVLVALVGEDGRVWGEVLSGANGGYRLQSAAAGRYTLRAERVGYRPVISPVLELAEGATVEYTLQATAERLVLPAISASAGKRCVTRSDPGVEVALLWSEARKALRSAAYTTAQAPYRYRVARRVRQFDPQTLMTREQREQTSEAVKASPFVTVAPEHLAEKGYVEEVGDTVLFHAPDAAILLSEEFLDAHCFRGEAADREHSGMVGLAFAPVSARERADVQGVLWMDASTAELRTLEYSYIGGPFSRPSPDAGGRVEFRRLPSGGWIVSRWRIRMPVRTETGRAVGSAPGRMAALNPGITEESGEVVEIRTAEGETVAMSTLASISGVVFDSTRTRPLPGARVQLAGTAYAAVADSAGRFTLPNVAEGVYSLSFTHPRLDSLRYTPQPVRVTAIPPQSVLYDLAIPPLSAVLTASCPAAPSGESAALGGVVTSAESGAPLGGVPVRAAWQRPGESGDSLRAIAISDDAGVYHFCELPARVAVNLSAALPGAAGVVRLEAGRAAVHDLAVQPSGEAEPAANGRKGTVVLRIQDATTSRPIAGVTVRMGGDVPAAVSDRRGMVTLAEVPSGSYGVELRHDGYGLVTTRVIVRGGARTELDVRVPKRPVTLEPLVVTARRVLPGQFNANSRGRRLDIFSREELDRLPAARNVGEVVARLPNVDVKYDDKGDVCIQSMRMVATMLFRGACTPVQLIVDDIVVGRGTEFAGSIPMNTVESVIFLKPTEAYAQYGAVGEFGVLLVYTRGNGPTVARGR